MPSRRFLVKMASLALVVFARGAWAQEPPVPETQAIPKPAARGIGFPSFSDPNETVEDSQASTPWQPDNGPVTGFQVPSLGGPQYSHSYWVPGLEYGSTIQSRPLGQRANNGWYANNYAGGDVSLSDNWGHSQLGVNASGGGVFSTDNQIGNGWYDQLAAAYDLTLRRAQVQLFDSFSYIPDSQFGFAGGTSLALPGIGGSLGPSIPGLATSIVPNQSIYAATGPRYSNAFAAQMTYQLSRQGSLTFGGSYGLLDFTAPGNVDNDMTTGSAGYNYSLSRTDSLGVLYRFSAYHYRGEPQAIGNHLLSLVYSKKITRRLALSLFGGPQISTYRVPIDSQSQHTSGSGGVTFDYAFQSATNVGMSYFHGLTGGSGIFTGSMTDQVGGTVGRRVGRVWTVNVNFGYARNSSLGGSRSVPNQSYEDWYVGTAVNRQFGRNINLAVSYSARFENSNTGCTGANCNTNYTQNLVSISLQWHTRPFVLE